MSLVPRFFGRRRSDPFSLRLWDPFEGFPFDSSLAPSSSFAAASVDWRETPQALVFKADLPGVGKEEVKVEVEDDRILQISGERTREKEERSDTWHRVERSSGKFVRRFRLPDNAKVDGIRADLNNGVLTVTVPRVEPKKCNVKTIEISG